MKDNENKLVEEIVSPEDDFFYEDKEEVGLPTEEIKSEKSNSEKKSESSIK